MAVVANRYMQALYELAKSEKEKDELEQELKYIADLFNSHIDFKNVMLDPRIKNNLKMEIIKQIMPECKQEIFINFIQLLLQENRINLIEEISEEFANKNSISKNELKIKIIVAHDIEEEQINQILEKFKKIYKVNKVHYKIQKDKTLLGGVKVAVGNTIYDDSIETKLEQIF